MLVKGKLSKQLYNNIKEKNSKPIELKDIDKSLKSSCDFLEKLVYEAISSIVITLPPGTVVVVGSPTTQTNATPIVIQGTIR